MLENYNIDLQIPREHCDKNNSRGYIPSSRIHEIIYKMDFRLIIQAALAGWVYEEKTGIAVIELRTGNLMTRSIDPDKVKEYLEDDVIAILFIYADENIYDEDTFLPISQMYYHGLITENEYKLAESEKDPQFINELRQRYYDMHNISLETLAVSNLYECRDMDLDYIHDQLREKY